MHETLKGWSSTCKQKLKTRCGLLFCLLSTMASGSPKKRFNFAESNQKIRMELRQADLKLKKEIERMEKQAYTARNNISNHQQVLKNSWRRLEQKRLEDQLSPMNDRRMKRNLQSDHDSRKRLMFANKTSLSFETALSHDNNNRSEDGIPNGPGNNRPATHTGRYRDDLTSTGSLPHINGETSNGLSQLKIGGNMSNGQQYMTGSPYISSPYAFRRYGGTQPCTSNSTRRGSHPLTRTTKSQQNMLVKSLHDETVHPTEQAMSGETEETGSHLPPLDSSISSRSAILNITPKTFDKNTLLKARKLMEIDSESRGPESFQQFYNSSSSSPSLSRMMMLTAEDLENMSESDLMEQLSLDEQEEIKKAKEEV